MKHTLSQGFARLIRRKLPRLLWGYYAVNLTPTGQALVLLWIVSAGQGAVEDLALPIYHIWAFLTLTLGVAWVLSWVSVPKLRLVRRHLHPISAGETLVFEVEIANLSRRTAYALTVMECNLPPGIRPVPDWQPEVLPRLGPGEKAVLSMRLYAARRGAYTLRGLYGVSAFHLGLCRGWCRSPQATSFLVYPAFTTPASFPVPEGRQYQPGGILMSSNVGDSSEFMHTREYRAGDNPRHVHWASWARLGKPIVKVYQEEYFVRLALVIDTQATTETDAAAFEATISVAAGIADALSRRDYIIDIVAAGATVYHFQAGRALAHVAHILEILACLEAAPQVDWHAVAAALLPEAPRLTAVVALLMDWTPEHAALLSQLQGVGVGVRIIVMRHGATTLSAPTMPPEMFVHLAPGADFPAPAMPEQAGVWSTTS